MRQVEPYITIRAVRPLVSGLQALGHDPAPLLAYDAKTLDARK